MGQTLLTLAKSLSYAPLFANDKVADLLIKNLAQVAFRRFVISSPRDNMTEAFRFSSRHSEFV